MKIRPDINLYELVQVLFGENTEVIDAESFCAQEYGDDSGINLKIKRNNQFEVVSLIVGDVWEAETHVKDGNFCTTL
jgi:hypothetical protein